MIKLRVLKPKGIEEFEKFINEVRKNKNTSTPDLNTNEFSSEFTPPIEIEEKKTFETRLETAKYLYEKFEKAGIKRNQIIGEENKGLWTWLAYIWFEQITNNRENISDENERYIASSQGLRYYKHLIAGSYYLFSLLGEEDSKLFLYSPSYKILDTVDHMGCYGYIIRYPNIVKTAKLLYWDEQENKPKTGASSDKPGCIRRFTTVINQLELTYNIYTMTPEEIISLLPEEFNEWKT